MKAAVYQGAGRLAVEEAETPKPSAGEVLVHIEANTICGTDLRIASGSKSKGVTLPRILGHELAGRVEAVGAGVTAYAVGDLVGMTPSVSCNVCASCTLGLFNLCVNARVLGHDIDGGLAEYILVPADAVRNGNLVIGRSDLPAEQLALAEPLSCVIHGQDFLSIGVHDVVLVVGGGAIGLLHAQLARVSGARVVIVSEPVASRRAVALKLGVDVVVDPTTEDLDAVVGGLTGGHGADVVIVCIGVPPLVNGALASARQRGRVSLFAGFPKDAMSAIDANLIHYKELAVRGSSNSTTAEYASAVSLIESGRIDVATLITHRFPLAEIADALAMAGSPEALKVVVLP